MNRLRLFFLVLSLLRIFFSASAIAQSPPCDPNLQPDGQQGEYAYRYYDDSRCEGIFIQNVASSALTLTSFTRTHEPDAFDSGILILGWPVPAAFTLDTVSLRATSHVYKLYYRMDAVDKEPTDGIYEWDTRIASNLELGSSDLGFVARTEIEWDVNQITQDVVLPLSIKRSPGTMIQSHTYEVVVMPQEELTQINYSVFKTQDGYVSDPEPIKIGGLGSGYYPAGRQVPFKLDMNEGEDDEGVYYLEISAVLPDNRVSRLEVYFYEMAR